MVIRARLKRIYDEATNVAAELRPEKLRNATNRHNKMTIIVGMSEAFHDYYQELFTREPALSDAYLVDFTRFSVTETAGCEGPE